MVQYLSVCHVNTNSVRNKFYEVKNLLMNGNIAVMALTESKLDPQRDSTWLSLDAL